MKKIIFLAIIFASVFTFSNCKKDDVSPLVTDPPTPATADILISIRKLASEAGTVNCNGLSVELHSNSLYTNKVKSTTSAGTTTAGTASFSAVPNGKYYLIAWKDVDASNSYTAGDLFGFVETPVILDGAAKAYMVDMYILKN